MTGFMTTLAPEQVPWILHSRGMAPQPGSPLLPFTGDSEAGSPAPGVADPAWGPAIGVLAAPDRQVRTIVPGPAETLVQVFYASAAWPAAGLVGCWPEQEGLRISFPWDADDIAALAASALRMGTPPPSGDGSRLTLTAAGTAALAGAVDAVRERLFASLNARRPVVSDLFDRADIVRMQRDGTAVADARWVVTLLRLLGPARAASDAEQGIDELHAAGLIRASEAGWRPEPRLTALAMQWRSPLPAVAHEVIELRDGAITRHGHRVAVRGDGPVMVLDYRGLSGDPVSVTLTAVDAMEYLDGLAQFLRPPAEAPPPPPLSESAPPLAC